MSALAFHGASARYGRQLALDTISLAIPTGALVAVVGPNGAGKSTFLKLAAGVLRPCAGWIERAQTFSYLPQAASLRRDLPLTVLQAVCTAFWPQIGNMGAVTAAQLQAARAALHEVGLLGCESRLLAALSGGQLQRLLFARVILQDAPLILLDEPFAAVDTATIRVLLQLIRVWHEEGRTVLCVLHDLALVERFFPTTLLLDRICRAFGATKDIVAQGLLADLQGVA